MIKYVVWGAGGRGKTVAEILGGDRIIAFIDSDPQKLGKNFCGKPIINLECYKRSFSNYAILVSLVYEQPVTDILKKEKLFFFSYNECPPELMGYGWKRAKDHLHKIELRKRKVVVYGHSLYSLLVYEYLQNAGYECLGLIHNRDLCKEDSEAFHRLFPNIIEKELDAIEDDTVILQTVSSYQSKEDLYRYRVKDIYDWRKYLSVYENPRIAELKDKYHGKRCFVVATGPSLTLDDLETLHKHNVFCISVNAIFYCFHETVWRPDQYVVMDVAAIEKFEPSYRSMNVKQKFIGDGSLELDYDNLTKEFYIYHSIYTKDTLEKGLISDDFSKYIYNSGTVTATCLQLAMYEGFKEIYLLGCDCSYFEAGLKHFKESEEMQITGYGEVEYLQYHINGYKKIKEYADNKKIKIYNATRGGYLEVFERVKFDELFT